MKKKVLSLLLSFCMIAMPFTVVHAEPVAESGTTRTVDSAQGLLDVAEEAESGDVVEISGDIDLDSQEVVFQEPVTLTFLSGSRVTYTSDNAQQKVFIQLKDGSVLKMEEDSSVSMIGTEQDTTEKKTSRDWRAIYCEGDLTVAQFEGSITVENAKGRGLYANQDLVFECPMAGTVTMNNPEGENRYLYGIVSYAGDVVFQQGIDESGSVFVDYGGGNNGFGIAAWQGQVLIQGDMAGDIHVEMGVSHAGYGIYGETGVTVTGDISGSVYSRGGSGSGYGIFAYSGDIAIAEISGTVQGDCYNKEMANSQSGASAIYAYGGSIYGSKDGETITPVQVSGELSSVVGRSGAFTVQANEDVYLDLLEGASILANSSYGAAWTELKGSYTPMSDNWGGTAACIAAKGKIVLNDGAEDQMEAVSQDEADNAVSADGPLLATGQVDSLSNIDTFLTYASLAKNDPDTYESYVEKANAKLTSEDKALIENYDEIAEQLFAVTVDSEEALKQALNDGETYIILGDDITLTAPLPGTMISGQDITIAGNDHKISFEGKTAVNNGVFGNDTNPLYADTTLTVKNVKFENTGDQGAYVSILGYNANGSHISYEGCSFKNLAGAAYVNPITQNPEKGIVLSITGCEYEDTLVAYGIDTTSEGAYAGDNVIQVIFDNPGMEQEGSTAVNVAYAQDANGYYKAYSSIQAAVDAAPENTDVLVAPGTYDENVSFNGKSVTLKGANAGVNPNDPEAKRGEESIFTGTMSTAGTAFEADQTVVIDGFKFTGDGLKVGDTNWNKVGNLTVKNCIMETGANKTADSGMNNAGNYFVKVSGGQTDDYANVVIQDNLVTGKAVENIYPIQAWNVQSAEITGNVIQLSGAENHQAINVTKPAVDAEITVSDNTIDGVGKGVYVTTATENGADFEGIVRVSNNTLTGAEEPFYIGWESNGHGNFVGMLIAGGNTNNGEPVEVIAHTKPDAPEEECLTATFVNDDGEEFGSITIPLSYDDDPDSVTIPLRAPEEIPEGYEFVGWKSENTGRIYDPVNVKELTLQADTVFVAQWEEVTSGTPDDGEEDSGQEEPTPDDDPDTDDRPSRPSHSSSGSTGGIGTRLPMADEDSTPAVTGFESDTNADLTVNGRYQFRITSLDSHTPVLTVNNANFTVTLASHSGNDYFYVITCAGTPGSTAAVSVDGKYLLTATVGGSASGVVSDTTHPFTVAQGGTYQFRLTAAARPSFAAGSASFTVEYAGQEGNDYFYKVHAVGQVGDGCGFYINGEAQPVAVATIA